MSAPPHLVVVGLGYGDEGKGSTIDGIAAHQPIHTVVRYGGHQAIHYTVRPDGVPHGFRQFGSATFHGARTHLSRHMLANPVTFGEEMGRLKALGVDDPNHLVTVEGEVLLTTAYHRIVNMLDELSRGGSPHGSCGMGIGTTMVVARDLPDLAVRVSDIGTPALREKLDGLRSWMKAHPEWERFRDHVPYPPTLDEIADCFEAFADCVSVVDEGYIPWLASRERLLFEASQGVLLDENHGWHPHTTWRTTTPAPALELLREAGVDADDPESVFIVGVMRTYMTRHGAGPLVTEDLDLAFPEHHNGDSNPYTGAFRRGHLDLAALRYAISRCERIDGLAITHLDRLSVEGVRACHGYLDADGVEWWPEDLPYGEGQGWIDGPQTEAALRVAGSTPIYRREPIASHQDPKTNGFHMAYLLQTPLAVGSTGPTHEDKFFTNQIKKAA